MQSKFKVHHLEEEKINKLIFQLIKHLSFYFFIFIYF